MADEDNEDVEDYMSDAFLRSLEDRAPKPPGVDPRAELPGWKRKARVRESTEANVKRQRAEKKVTVTQERLAVGLDTPISADNKGFQLLAKMGYKAGTGLGPGAKGMATPVSVEVKTGRQGLGLAAAKRQQAAARDRTRQLHATRRERAVANLQADFRLRMRQKHLERQAVIDLPKAQHACEILDRKLGLESSALWFQEPKPEPEVDDRTLSHHPGGAVVAAETTTRPSDGAADGESAVAVSEYDAFASLETSERLSIVVDYLRDAHHYCFWCGTEHASAQDMEAECAECSSDNRA
eukprot:m.48435 g.48435  ORF g.48435 m.48435 type:complete len:296 (-) comp6993_c0_seq1:77-964(-)